MSKKERIATIEMECPNCSAQMELSADGKSMKCSYCGTQIHITESDEVKKERIRNETIRLNHQASLEYQKKKDEEAKKRSDKEKNTQVRTTPKTTTQKITIQESTPKKKATGTLVFMILFCMASVGALSNHQYFAAGVMIVETILLFFIWYCKRNGVFRKNDLRFVILKVLPFLLFITLGFADDIQDSYFENKQNKQDIKERMAAGASTYNWPGTKTAAVLPEAQYEYGKLIKSTEEKLELDIYQISQKDYSAYIKQCKQAGFTYYETASENIFQADNEDHYHLELTWTEDKNTFNTMNISLEAPLKMAEITWPTTECAKLFPEPPSLIGNILVSNDKQLLCFISGISQEQYKAYVDEYIAKGFGVEHRFEKICSLTYPDDSTKKVSIELDNWDVIKILADLKEK